MQKKGKKKTKVLEQKKMQCSESDKKQLKTEWQYANASQKHTIETYSQLVAQLLSLGKFCYLWLRCQMLIKDKESRHAGIRECVFDHHLWNREYIMNSYDHFFCHVYISSCPHSLRRCEPQKLSGFLRSDLQSPRKSWMQDTGTRGKCATEVTSSVVVNRHSSTDFKLRACLYMFWLLLYLRNWFDLILEG